MSLLIRKKRFLVSKEPSSRLRSVTASTNKTCFCRLLLGPSALLLFM